VNEQEAWGLLRKHLKPEDQKYIQDLELPPTLNDYLYEYIEDQHYNDTSIDESFSSNYAEDKQLTESNWNELKQVLAVYYSPLYQALL